MNRRLLRRAAGPALAALLGLAFAIFPSARANSPDLLAPPLHVDQLDNGLKVVSLPLDDPDLVVFATIIRAGGRNEADPGSEGFARLLERLTARGPSRSPRAFDAELLVRLGARAAGFVADDATIRTIVFDGRENLEGVVRGEADRIVNLEIDAATLPSEAAALAGEAAVKAAGGPEARLEEALRRTAFAAHPYGRPLFGTRSEMSSLPERIAAGQQFKKRAYAPDNVILLAAGDVTPGRLLELVRKYYGSWEKSNFEFTIPAEPLPDEPRRVRVAWDVPTRARLAVGFRVPAFSDQAPDKAALDLLASIAFSSSSPLYDRLVRREKLCLTLEAAAADRRDPYLLIVNASAAAEMDLAQIEKAILAEIERLKTELVSPRALTAAKAGRRSALQMAMETTEGRAAVLSRFIALTGDPESLGRVNGLYERISPAELREAARRYLKTATTATLALGPPPDPAAPQEPTTKESRR
jgi:zinc protease